MSFDQSQLEEIIANLEEQKFRTKDPFIARNCERSIQIYQNQLDELTGKDTAVIPAARGGIDHFSYGSLFDPGD